MVLHMCCSHSRTLQFTNRKQLVRFLENTPKLANPNDLSVLYLKTLRIGICNSRMGCMLHENSNRS